MRIREFTTAGKHYTDKQLCLKALDLLSEALPIESLHASYNGTENSVSAWFTFAKVSSCFKVEFIDLPELIAFINDLQFRDPPTGMNQGKPGDTITRAYQGLQKIIQENS